MFARSHQIRPPPPFSFFFFFNDPATPEIYPLSLHHALPIPISGTPVQNQPFRTARPRNSTTAPGRNRAGSPTDRSEEHTSELQSRLHLVCRLLLEKKNNRDVSWTNHRICTASQSSDSTVLAI